MKRSRHRLLAAAPYMVVALAMTMLACVTRPVEKPTPRSSGEVCKKQPLFLDKDVDILFVIDNSGSMEQEQTNLAKQFPKLIEALRTAKLGANKPLPNVRIGVVSSDLGAGNLYQDNACVTDGDKGRLHSKAMVAGCKVPNNPWIEYKDGKTNITGASGDAIAQVKNAFTCIAQLGTDGCGFEQTIMSAKKALDPAVNINPGFLRNEAACKPGRQDALLAVVFITDEDDCSASNHQLFDPSQQGLNDPLGPLTSFRCFEFGVTCECTGKPKCDRFTQGVWKNCVGTGKYLHSVSNFISFFQSIKKLPDLDEVTGKCQAKNNPDRVIMAAIAGPTDRVEVGLQASYPILKASCSTTNGFAVPAIRVKELVHAFAKELTLQEVADIKAKKKNIPYFVDKSGVWREENFTSVCANDFSPALERLGERIVGALGTLCLSPPALTEKGGILCRKGDVICSAATCGKKVVCTQSCLTKAKFTIQESTATGRTTVNKCSDKLWDPVKYNKTLCGNECPCWRIVHSATCAAQTGSSPYSVEIMRKGEAAKGTYGNVCALSSPYPWGSKEFGELKQCN